MTIEAAILSLHCICQVALDGRLHLRESASIAMLIHTYLGMSSRMGHQGQLHSPLNKHSCVLHRYSSTIAVVHRCLSTSHIHLYLKTMIKDRHHSQMYQLIAIVIILDLCPQMKRIKQVMNEHKEQLFVLTYLCKFACPYLVRILCYRSTSGSHSHT